MDEELIKSKIATGLQIKEMLEIIGEWGEWRNVLWTELQLTQWEKERSIS